MIKAAHAPDGAFLANLAAGYDIDIEKSVALADRVLARDPSHVRALTDQIALAHSVRVDVDVDAAERLAQQKGANHHCQQGIGAGHEPGDRRPGQRR